MPEPLPPPADHLDGITDRWLAHGGPVPDPERDALDPDHLEPVELVDPIPPELAEPEEPPSS